MHKAVDPVEHPRLAAPHDSHVTFRGNRDGKAVRSPGWRRITTNLTNLTNLYLEFLPPFVWFVRFVVILSCLGPQIVLLSRFLPKVT
jgi:hypothetical protein